jgi:hypothetical protein
MSCRQIAGGREGHTLSAREHKLAEEILGKVGWHAGGESWSPLSPFFFGAHDQKSLDRVNIMWVTFSSELRRTRTASFMERGPKG